MPTPRLKELCRIASIPVDPKQVKLEAWFIKGCCVLLKKKVSRAQWPKNRQFRLLMAALVGRQLGDDDGSDENDGNDRSDHESAMSVRDGGAGGVAAMVTSQVTIPEMGVMVRTSSSK